MAVYSDNLIDERNGLPIEGANLWVYDNLGVEATLTDTLDQPLTQPLVTDADGGFEYKVADGVYRHDFWKNSVMIYRDNRVIVGTPATIEASLGAFGISLIANATADDALSDLGLSASSGSSKVGFLQSGSGALLRTAQDKMRDTVSVKDFYNPSDPDDTLSFTRALATGKKVYAPAGQGSDSGKYLVDVVTLPANTFIFGDGPSTILRQKSTFVGGSTGSLYANSGSASATVDNITIRDLRIEGTNIATPTFSQFKHLISLNGVRNVLIDNVQIIGFQGDGIYFGSGVNASDERHNYNVVVRNCFFDGINNENRNGISVIDGDDGVISGCTFQNCGKSTMPGAIDFEPDDATYHIVKKWIVENNTFSAVGGNFGCIGMLFPPLVPLPSGFIIRNNVFSNYAGTGAEIAIDARRTLTTASASMQILVDGNSGKSGNRPIDLYACKGVTITDTNQFESYDDSSIIGFTGSTDLAIDVVEQATYIGVGSADTRAIRIGKVDGATFGGKKIECATNTASSYVYQFLAATVLNVTFEGLRIKKRSSQVIAINDTGATFTASGNRFINNQLDGLTSQFQSQTYTTTTASLLASWTGTADIEINGNVAVLQFSISGGTQTVNTQIATVPAGARPRAQTRAVFGSGSSVVELRFDTDGAVFITPNAAPASTIRGSISYTLPV